MPHNRMVGVRVHLHLIVSYTNHPAGQFLDRYGRTRTIGVIVLGTLVNDILTMFIFRFSDILPGKYWILVITPVLEGIM